MNPLQVTATPTMICFKDLPEELANNFHDEYELKWHEKRKEYYITGTPACLYNVILSLSYTYDIEIS